MKSASCLFLLFLLSFSMNSFAQTPQLDSLHAIAKESAWAERPKLYSKLADLAKQSHPDTALYFARQSLHIADSIGTDIDKSRANAILGRVLSLKGSYDLSMKYFREGLQLATSANDDSLIAVAHIGMGNSYWQLGKHALALENHFKGLQIREQLGDQRGINISKANIGMVYQSQGKLPLAEKYVQEALAGSATSEASVRISMMHTLANIYGMQGKIDEAMKIDEQGIELAEKTSNQFAKSLFYDNMGNCYLYGNPPDYAKAIEYFNKTLLIDSVFANKKQMSDSYVNLGSVFLAQKKYNESIPYLLRSIKLAEESGYIQGKLKALQSLSTAYQQSGDATAAYKTLQQSIRTKDSLVNVTSEAKMAELQTVYETEKKQQQINLQQAEISKKNFIITSVVLLIILLALLGFSAYRRFRLQEKARLQAALLNQQELATKAVIKAEEDERQRIARDLHDGIGQMMSAAKMNLSAFESELKLADEEKRGEFGKIISLVDESCRELRSVSHNMMPNALLRNSLASAIRDFIDKIEGRNLKIHLFTEGLDERLDSNVEIVLYRVIQECVNNVIRHANATTLDISLIRDKDGISATIEDNGKGFDATDVANFKGIGMRNIISRVEYLKGVVEFDSAPGRGTAVGITVPLRSSGNNN